MINNRKNSFLSLSKMHLPPEVDLHLRRLVRYEALICIY